MNGLNRLWCWWNGWCPQCHIGYLIPYDERAGNTGGYAASCSSDSGLATQRTEAVVKCPVLNRMTQLGMPETVWEG